MNRMTLRNARAAVQRLMLPSIAGLLAASGALAQVTERGGADVRDLAALLFFNGEQGARAFDASGPIGDDDALWSREAPGRYEFVTARPGVTVRGSKLVTVEPGCVVRIDSRFTWHFAAKPAETLDRTEEFDFTKPVVADAILALKDDRPYAVVLDLKSNDGFYCIATRINGALVEARRCSADSQSVVAPGREDSPVMDHFRRFSMACRSTREGR
jgi:hypothetical protein